jgi:hypothetical protein
MVHFKAKAKRLCLLNVAVRKARKVEGMPR